VAGAPLALQKPLGVRLHSHHQKRKILHDLAPFLELWALQAQGGQAQAVADAVAGVPLALQKALGVCLHYPP